MSLFCCQGERVVINWDLNKRICAAEGDREALLRLVAEEGPAFDAVNVATCLNRLKTNTTSISAACLA
jgi:GTPase Era involved in 16S rRNA processing